MKKADSSKGFFGCFLGNIMLHYEWLIAAAILFGLYLWLHIPWIFILIVLALGILQAFILAALVCWGNKCANVQQQTLPNKNPYSAKSQDMINPVNKQQRAVDILDNPELLKGAKLMLLLGIDKEEQAVLLTELYQARNMNPKGLLEMLSRKGYLHRFSGQPSSKEVAEGLNQTAKTMELPPVPEEFMKEVPHMEGAAAASYIAARVNMWRVFIVLTSEDNFNGEGFYAGLVSKERAEDFVKAMEAYLDEGSSIVLLYGP